jgi:hypothetical protein
MKTSYSLQFITVLASLFLAGQAAFAQFPTNGDFESWGDFGQWFTSPEGWITSNTETDQDIFQSTDAYEGNYSMEVQSTDKDVFQQGETWTSFLSAAPILTVSAHVKATIDGQAQVAVACERYLDGLLLTTSSWSSNVSITEWQFITFTTEEIESDSTVIRVLCVGGDFAFGEATILVDSMQVDEVIPQSIPSQPKCEYRVYNTGFGTIQIDGRCLPEPTIVLYDQRGQIVATADVNRAIATTQLSPGMYVVSISDGNFRQTTSVVVQ